MPVKKTESLKITVINGPGFQRLGIREPEIYGSETLEDLTGILDQLACELDVDLTCLQFDNEGEIVSAIWDRNEKTDGIIINPGGYSHSSVAILDAMKGFDGPVAEVHMSNVISRESYRNKLVTAEGADIFIAGAGFSGYKLALRYVVDKLKKNC